MGKILYTITMKGLQSIRDEVVIPLEEGVVTRFYGDNNAGKSILTKTLRKCLCVDLHGKKREVLINKEKTFGELTIKRHYPFEKSIKFHLAREASETFYEYEDVNGVIKRTLAMKGLEQLIEKFGFHELSNLTLHIHETFGPLLMLTTQTGFNYDLVEDIVTDSRANKALISMEQQKLEIESFIHTATTKSTAISGKLSMLKEFDLEYELAVSDAINRNVDLIDLAEELPKLTGLRLPVPAIDFSKLQIKPLLKYNLPVKSESFLSGLQTNAKLIYNLPVEELDYLKGLIPPKQSELKLPVSTKTNSSLLKLIPRLHDFKEVIRDMEQFRNDICPTCGRGVLNE